MSTSTSRPDVGADEHRGDERELDPASRSSVVVADGCPGLPDRWLAVGAATPLSAAAERCTTRFAAHEADVTVAELTGLGRASAVRSPRLGGVLFGKVPPGGHAAALLTAGVERSVRAGYRAATATSEATGRPSDHGDVDALWGPFLAASYRIPRSVAATVRVHGRYDESWAELLAMLALDGDATRLGRGRVSLLSRSLRGLRTVGIALALSEQGDRTDVTARRRTTTRRARRGGGDLPAAPRSLPDPVD